MGHRNRRSSAEWQILIEEQLSSGLTGLAFCNERGLSAKTFYRQRKRLGYARRQAMVSGAGGFVQVQPEIPTVTKQPMVLHYRDSRLELGNTVSADWLAELLRAL